MLANLSYSVTKMLLTKHKHVGPPYQSCILYILKKKIHSHDFYLKEIKKQNIRGKKCSGKNEN